MAPRWFLAIRVCGWPCRTAAAEQDHFEPAKTIRHVEHAGLRQVKRSTQKSPATHGARKLFLALFLASKGVEPGANFKHHGGGELPRGSTEGMRITYPSTTCEGARQGRLHRASISLYDRHYPVHARIFGRNLVKPITGVNKFTTDLKSDTYIVSSKQRDFHIKAF